MADFSHVAGDTRPIMRAVLTDKAGVAVDLSGGTTTYYARLTRTNGTAQISRVCTYGTANGTDGSVACTPGTADFLIAGDYESYFRCVWADGTKITFPHPDASGTPVYLQHVIFPALE